MQLAFSSNAYLRHSIEETIARVAGFGYRGIELLADVPHAWPAGLLAESKDSIRRTLEFHGLTISNINAFMMNAVADPRQPYWHPSWIDPDPHYRAIRREHTKRAVELAHDLGAPHITTEPGGPLFDSQTWQSAADIFYDELMPCLDVAERLGVPILIEPEPGLLIERFDQYREFVERIDSSLVGLNFDVGHAYCVGEDPQDWIAPMQGHTRHYHLEDIASTRVHQHLVPGRGAIDFAATLAEIQATGYDGWLTVELYPYLDDPDAAAREAKQFLDGVLKELQTIRLYSMEVKGEFYTDDRGVPRAVFAPPYSVVGCYLEDDVQSSSRSCDDMLKICELIRSGKEEFWQGTGNAHTVEMKKGGLVIVNEFAVGARSCQIPIKDFAQALLSWRNLIVK